MRAVSAPIDPSALITSLFRDLSSLRTRLSVPAGIGGLRAIAGGTATSSGEVAEVDAPPDAGAPPDAWVGGRGERVGERWVVDESLRPAASGLGLGIALTPGADALPWPEERLLDLLALLFPGSGGGIPPMGGEAGAKAGDSTSEELRRSAAARSTGVCVP